MPELPEVQTVVDALISSGIVDVRIKRATVSWPKTIATSDPQTFCRRIKNRVIANVRRRAKYILFDLDDTNHLAVHLRMTGRFELEEKTTTKGAHVHVILDLSDGRRLLFHDTRKFGRFYLTKDLSEITGALGPEPMSPGFTAKSLREMLMKRKRQIKPLLLDQTFLSGLGNIYADEALWAAGIHPQRPANTLEPNEIKALHRSVRSVLRQGLKNAGTSLGRGLGNYAGLQNKRGRNSDYLKVFRRNGQACQRCGQEIQRIVVGQRSTHFCEKCQS